MSAMADEIAQCPDALRAFVPVRIPFTPAPVAIVCGRGSSGHAGTYLRYLIETRLGIPVSMTAPSVLTSFASKMRMRDALFFVVSQSGRSPDLVVATQAARAAGARTIAFVNAPSSPVADAAEYVVPLAAGEERSVAATKSVVASMAAAARLIADWADDRELAAGIDLLPGRLRLALALDWSGFFATMAASRCAYVTGRGLALGTAREIALKCAETLRLPALAYSAAELLHGPRAAIDDATPVLALRLADATASSVDTLAASLRASGAKLALCGAGGDLPWIGDGHPAADAIAMLIPAYLAIERTARALGFDPDRPPHLNKVTETL